MMRVFWNRLKEPIYKDDLKYVLINGGLAFITVGFLIGLIDGLLFNLGSSFSFLTIAIGILIALRIRKSYYTYHIVYPICAVVFSLLGFLVSCFSFLIAIKYPIKYAFDYFVGFFNIFSKSFYRKDDVFMNFISLCAIILMCIMAYRIAKKD